MTPEIETMPMEAQQAYAQGREKATGMDDPSAHEHAMRHLRLAGWYKTHEGWKQLAPDVRDKVNIRKAVRQPNGKYVIPDVPVFYPNTVKENTAHQFSPTEVRDFVRNTNEMVNAGSQRPGLIEGHVNPMRLAIHGEPKSRGFGVNWRVDEDFTSPTRHVVFCDLVDVEPEAVQDFAEKKFTGLSLGFATDQHGSNRRVGHIAQLGGEIQALSRLPVTEIYATDAQVCFSAPLEVNEEPAAEAKGPVRLSLMGICLPIRKGLIGRR
jgi:hypothetical protein